MMSSRAARARVLPATLPRVAEAVEALRREKVIGVPTDTIYGLAASACSEKGIQRLYEAKQRAYHVPLAVCVGEASDVSKYADVAHLNPGLLEELLPGPITLLLRRKTDDTPLSSALNPDAALLGVRVPDSEFIRAVARAYGHAIALTSANPSGKPSTLAVEEFEHLWSECAGVFDADDVEFVVGRCETAKCLRSGEQWRRRRRVVAVYDVRALVHAGVERRVLSVRRRLH